MEMEDERPRAPCSTKWLIKTGGDGPRRVTHIFLFGGVTANVKILATTERQLHARFRVACHHRNRARHRANDGRGKNEALQRWNKAGNAPTRCMFSSSTKNNDTFTAAGRESANLVKVMSIDMKASFEPNGACREWMHAPIMHFDTPHRAAGITWTAATVRTVSFENIGPSHINFAQLSELKTLQDGSVNSPCDGHKHRGGIASKLAERAVKWEKDNISYTAHNVITRGRRNESQNAETNTRQWNARASLVAVRIHSGPEHNKEHQLKA